MLSWVGKVRQTAPPPSICVHGRCPFVNEIGLTISATSADFEREAILVRKAVQSASAIFQPCLLL